MGLSSFQEEEWVWSGKGLGRDSGEPAVKKKSQEVKTLHGTSRGEEVGIRDLGQVLKTPSRIGTECQVVQGGLEG